MKIPELYEHKKPVFSLEIFPPKKKGNIESIYDTVIRTLSALPTELVEIWQTTLHVRLHPASRNSMGSNP